MPTDNLLLMEDVSEFDAFTKKEENKIKEKNKQIRKHFINKIQLSKVHPFD